jgi:hypothetical protein
MCFYVGVGALNHQHPILYGHVVLGAPVPTSIPTKNFPEVRNQNDRISFCGLGTK